MSSDPKEWDARAYHRIAAPQLAWGLRVLDRLELAGDETVLDAGCGSGRLTEKLLERLPRGKVIALDRSEQMLAQAREHLAPYGTRVEILSGDLEHLALPRVADVVFSAATFHWIHDHDALFRGLYAALRPGGRLCAQCGGGKNLNQLHHRAMRLAESPRYAPAFIGWREPWNYADAEQTAQRLTRAGFVGVRTWMEEAPTPFDGPEPFAEFCAKVVLRNHLGRLPEPLREPFLAELVQEAAHDSPPFTLDYWRLNLEARRAA